MDRKPLSNVDTAWLRMEDPTNLMMISGVMVFSEPMDFERLKTTIRDGLLSFDRFRQRVVWPRWPGGRLYWEEDPDFDLDYHLRRVSLAPPGDQAALQEVASELASTQLDLHRPLWQFHLVENCGQGCALVCRLHHCIGDGMALVYVLLSLTSTDPDFAPCAAEPAEPARVGRRRTPALLRPAGNALRTTRRLTRVLVKEGMEIAAHPERAQELSRTGADGAAALARLVLRWPDPKTIFKGKLGIPKRAAWSGPIPVSDVKRVGRGLGGTINDVLLAAVSGALRSYMETHGERTDGVDFRAVVPVNLRKPGTEAELGNKFGLVFLSLPVGTADRLGRLYEVRRRMDELKGSLEAPVAFGILNTIGMVAQQIQDVVVDIFGSKGTAVMTNVMGPPIPLYLAGAPLDSLMFWVPQSGHLGMGVSILSYAGQVRVGIITDQGLVPDPDTIVAGVQTEFEEYLALARAAAEQPPAKKMAAALGEALDELGGILETRAVTGTSPGEAPLCQGRTREGRPCKNRALPGSAYCRVHQER